MTDDVLIGRIAGGDTQALAELFARRQQNVYRFALHLTGSTSIADDVTQDVFVAVMRDAGRFEPGRAPVAAWLCGIARNHVRRRLAFEARAQSLDGDDGTALTLPAVTQDPLDDITSAEQLATLRRAILSLPLKYREPIVLCELQEMAYADAASALDVPIGTLKSRLNRGRALLTVKMQAHQRETRGRVDAVRISRCIA